MAGMVKNPVVDCAIKLPLACLFARDACDPLVMGSMLVLNVTFKSEVANNSQAHITFKWGVRQRHDERSRQITVRKHSRDSFLRLRSG